MANKLKKMKYTSVDMVPRGANPEAYIKLAKSLEGGEEEMSQLLTDFISEVVNKIISGKKNVVEKSQNPTGEMFDNIYALFDSFCSIHEDSNLSSIAKADMMREGLEDFNVQMASCFDDWAEGRCSVEKSDMSEYRLQAMKEMRNRLDEIIQAALKDDTPSNTDDDTVDDIPEEAPDDIDKKCSTKVKKEELSMPMVDLEKMSTLDRALVEAIAKKYSGEEHEEEQQKEQPENPAVQKALNELDEIKRALDMEKMTAIAKKYEIIGKKADETAEMLYNLKKSDEKAYDNVIAVYDEMVNVQKESGIFKEYGKNGTEDAKDLNSIVAELRKSFPQASMEELVVKAYELNPNLDQKTGQLK